jgi:hypothetical protein
MLRGVRHGTGSMVFARAALACAALAAGCDQMSSDIGDASNSLFPPSPAEAGRWAVDNSDPENQRRGVLLLGNSGFGGEKAYIDLYRLYIEENTDPLVKQTAIQALARHGTSEDAVLVAKQLDSPVEQIRLAAARGLQRLHNPAIADQVWKKLIREDEPASIRVELAIAMGQYATRDSFEALCSALDDLITGADFGLDPGRWRAWRDATKQAFRDDVPYYFPTFERELGFGDYVMFWAIPTFEQPGVPAGMRVAPEPAAPAAAPTPAAAPSAPAAPAPAVPPPAAPPAA